jgi:hypothetical protein
LAKAGLPASVCKDAAGAAALQFTMALLRGRRCHG